MSTDRSKARHARLRRLAETGRVTLSSIVNQGYSDVWKYHSQDRATGRYVVHSVRVWSHGEVSHDRCSHRALPASNAFLEAWAKWERLREEAQRVRDAHGYKAYLPFHERAHDAYRVACRLT